MSNCEIVDAARGKESGGRGRLRADFIKLYLPWEDSILKGWGQHYILGCSASKGPQQELLWYL